MSDPAAFRDALVGELERAGDPERAAGQQRYMKSDMPFHGVTVPRVREIARALARRHPFACPERWRATILALWRQAARREERYAAVELLVHRRYRTWLVPDSADLVEELVVTGAWWDYVDTIAAHGVGAMLGSHPARTGRLLRRWARDDNLWKRRTAILAQLRRGPETDWQLLVDAIEPSLESPEFFLRKATGWALREYSKVDAGTVLAWVNDNGDRLSALSKREGLRHLAARGVIPRCGGPPS